MRVSVIKDDVGYRSDAWRFEVYLDGEVVDDVLTADEEEGEIVLIKHGKVEIKEKK